ncbi:hypothetical protein AMATHDRAFT_148199 [Amanita thiersii Skay4041]|uniref:Zinc finger C3HC4 RING-type domain-containing protein n=1 Tax=Amanita thiersii Skay4041 TaxID=703135 RepID=A0A2A9NGK2_9AGAR|nr:hypothetical protein AMATHDRAFT_148199 [Amanita thiersii Skay4041]
MPGYIVSFSLYFGHQLLIICSILTKLANPCGHSFCEPCGVMWFKKKSRCAICRTQLWWTCPMLPNVAMDNTVEKYIKMLASSGQDEWKDNGEKYKEWVDRKE